MEPSIVSSDSPLEFRPRTTEVAAARAVHRADQW
jgi:hypothetical protein